MLAFASHDGIHFQTLDPFFLASTCATTTSLGWDGMGTKERAVGGGQLEPKWHTNKLANPPPNCFKCHAENSCVIFFYDTQQGHHPTLRQVGFLKALLECLHLPAMMGSISKPWIPSFWLQLVPPPPPCSACKLRHFVHVTLTELDSNMKFPP